MIIVIIEGGRECKLLLKSGVMVIKGKITIQWGNDQLDLRFQVQSGRKHRNSVYVLMLLRTQISNVHQLDLE